MILDLFAGPGGWDEGALSLGLTDVLGLEKDDAACRTRYAAGHKTWQTDIATVNPCIFAGQVDGLIASPPCQDFSAAGKKAGIKGTRGQLVHEVMRWTNALLPDWLCCEQVPSVLAIWRSFQDELASLGYSTWTGILNAADYGVPQSRTRAILMASRTDAAIPPDPTHAEEPEPAGMFTAERKRWITMAEGLGWPAGYWVQRERSGDRSEEGFDPDAGPSQALTSKNRSWSIHHKWAWDRPATVVCADPRLSPPGYRGRPEDYGPDGEYRGKRSMDECIRLTVEEALTLQSFRPDYPVQGSRTKQFEQVGNAIPPAFAAAIIEKVAA